MADESYVRATPGVKFPNEPAVPSVRLSVAGTAPTIGASTLVAGITV